MTDTPTPRIVPAPPIVRLTAREAEQTSRERGVAILLTHDEASMRYTAEGWRDGAVVCIYAAKLTAREAVDGATGYLQRLEGYQ